MTDVTGFLARPAVRCVHGPTGGRGGLGRGHGGQGGGGEWGGVWSGLPDPPAAPPVLSGLHTPGQ